MKKRWADQPKSPFGTSRAYMWSGIDKIMLTITAY